MSYKSVGNHSIFEVLEADDMEGSTEILKRLYRSMVDGSMLGLFVRKDAKSSFIITKVRQIADDPADPENKVISLSDTDIYGNYISDNPIMSKNIVDIRDYNRLQGISYS